MTLQVQPVENDVAWQEVCSPPATVAAARLHVLQLAPIKARLDKRWPRLSDLVHKLFEEALKRAQGPRDHFVALDELSYVVTFHGLTVEEAGIACAAIAKDVCDRLFGDGIDDVAVRSLVGTVPAEAVARPMDSGHVAALLEKTGVETLVRTHAAPPGGRRPGEAMLRAHKLLGSLERELGLFAVWDLAGRKSNTLFAAPHAAGLHKSLRRLMAGDDERRIVEAEILLLEAAGEYAYRVHAAQRVCAIGVGVSYESLSGFASRIRYVGALKQALALPHYPFLLKIEQVAEGTPLGRLAELIAMLRLPNLRILLEFASGAAIPNLDVRLGVHGIGANLPERCDAPTARFLAQKLARRAMQQKAFGFAGGLDTAELAGAVRGAQALRFGVGGGLDGGLQYTGLESVPDFPLML